MNSTQVIEQIDLVKEVLSMLSEIEGVTVFAGIQYQSENELIQRGIVVGDVEQLAVLTDKLHEQVVKKVEELTKEDK